MYYVAHVLYSFGYVTYYRQKESCLKASVVEQRGKELPTFF